MRLIPSIIDENPRLGLAICAMSLSTLLRLAHPEGSFWHFAAGFFAGLGLALLIAYWVRRWKARA